MGGKIMKDKDREGIIMTTSTTVQKWGNSLAIRIPKEVAEKVAFYQGTELEMRVTETAQIYLTPVKNKPSYSLDELLEHCHSKNKHDEIDFGMEGRELL